MPLYEYQCVKCGQRFERIEKVDSKPVKKCPLCGGRAERTLAPSAIQFKGSGWYATDYARKGTSASGDSKESKHASESTPKETAPAKETKKSKDK